MEWETVMANGLASEGGRLKAGSDEHADTPLMRDLSVTMAVTAHADAIAPVRSEPGRNQWVSAQW